jgi:hypothetical protein
VINLVCDHGLLFGYASQKRRVDRQIVNQAIGYLEDNRASQARLSRVRRSILRNLVTVRWSLWSVAVALAALVATLGLQLDDAVMAFARSMRHLVAR